LLLVQWKQATLRYLFSKPFRRLLPTRIACLLEGMACGDSRWMV